MTTVLYPGSFDPVTNGHLDIIRRAASLFDRVVVTVFTNTAKSPTFSVEERVAMVREATADLNNVEVDSFGGLLVDYARRRGIRVIVKGLRAISDFDYEFQQAQINRELGRGVETLFMMTRTEYLYLSSSLVKEIARFGGDVRPFVPEGVYRRLMERFRGGADSL